MKDYKILLTSVVEVVTFLLIAFGGFLKNIAPQDQVGAYYPVGILSFLLLIILISDFGDSAKFSEANRRKEMDFRRRRVVRHCRGTNDQEEGTGLEQ